jgi:FRG domain
MRGLCKELLIAHYDEFQGDQYCFDRLVRMQHYGLPTRLLDISGNPLVALFFACFCAPELAEIDGEVILFRVSSEKVKYYDSDTVSCLANLSRQRQFSYGIVSFGDSDSTIPQQFRRIRIKDPPRLQVAEGIVEQSKIWAELCC